MEFIKKIFSKGELPTTLDVVDFGEQEHQVVAVTQGLFLLKNIETEEVFRVLGIYKSYKITREPDTGNIHRRDEGIRVTGRVIGKIQE